MRVDYYKFSVYAPDSAYRLNGYQFRTLHEAKEAYLQHLYQGHRLSCCIEGCTIEDDCIFLTYTPWWSDVKSFGRTKLTWKGEENLKKKRHEIQ